MLLAVDAGNTKTKWAVFDAQGVALWQDACLNSDIAHADFPPKAYAVQSAVVGNVAHARHGVILEQRLQQHGVPYRLVNATHEACGVVNCYHTPRNLGIDRWAAMIAAYHQLKQVCLVVNAGTAITVDALQLGPTGAVFVGGVIAPGLHLMLTSLQQNAAKLDVGVGNDVDFPVTTKDAIFSGCVGAVVGLIQLQWQHLHDRTNVAPKLVLSGGDASVFAKNLPQHLLKQHIIVDNLVLSGLMYLGFMQLGLMPLGREAE